MQIHWLLSEKNSCTQSKAGQEFKESDSELPKNDWVDAFIIADHLRFGRIAREIYMDDYRYNALQTLIRARFDIIQNLTREKQRFANYLLLKCSGIVQDKNIANSSATTSALMERVETVDDMTNANPDGCQRFLPSAIMVNNSVNQAMAVSIASMWALENRSRF